MTAEEFYEWTQGLDWDRRFELLDGEPVERPLEGKRHGFVCSLVGRILGDYLVDGGIGYACTNNTGLIVAQVAGHGPRPRRDGLSRVGVGYRRRGAGLRDATPGPRR